MQFNPSDNYFKLLGVKPTFDIRHDELAAHHKKLQSVLHPDRYVTASPQEQRIAVQHATLVNEAYRVLTDDCERAAYLLTLKHVTFNPELDTISDPNFLIEQMELRETIEATNSLPELSELKASMDNKTCEIGGQFEQMYFADNLEQARELVAKMQFFRKLSNQIEEKIRFMEESAVSGVS